MQPLFTSYIPLHQEFLHGPALRSCKQQCTSDAVVEINRIFWIFLDILQEGRRGPVSCMFGVVSVKITDAVRGIPVAIPPQILHDWLVRSSMRLLIHDRFVSNNRVLRIRLAVATEKVEARAAEGGVENREGVGEQCGSRPSGDGERKCVHHDGLHCFFYLMAICVEPSPGTEYDIMPEVERGKSCAVFPFHFPPSTT